MIEFAFFDNLIEFLDELYELLKEDWLKFKLFVKENKKNLIWIFFALITLQFTNILNIGNSCNKYYKNKNIQTIDHQKGGSNAVAGPSAGPSGDAAGAAAPAAADAGPMTKEAFKAKEKAEKTAKIDAAKKKIVEKKEAKKTAKEGDSESKNVQKNLDLFNQLKGKVSNAAGQHGLAGPIFGNLEGVMGGVTGLFTVFATLLVVFGILSLPVLIFIIITYCIIKMIVGKIAVF